jgi:hypothetical protein
MAYTLKLTNGKILVTLPDQTVDQQSTSLTLIGKNVNAYGTYYNDNLLGLLENFASGDPPRSPQVGQLWFNTIAGRMYYFNENYQFRPVGGPILSSVQPAGLVAGDLWLDTTAKQLKYFDGSVLSVAGPQYSAVTGKAGWVVEAFDGTDLQSHTVANLYNNGTLMAILSNETFTLATPVSGITTVTPGINMIKGFKVAGTATAATSVAGVDATRINAFFNTSTAYVTGTMIVNKGIAVEQGDIQIYTDDLTGATISSDKHANDLTIQVGLENIDILANPVLRVKTATKRIGIWNADPQYDLDIKGNTRIQGDLVVIGRTTGTLFSNLELTTATIELAYPSKNDVDLNGAGIILHGSTPHTILYRPSFNGWEFNNTVNIVGPATLNIDGASVFTPSGSGVKLTNVTGAPDLTSVGTLTNIQVGLVSITTGSISTVDSSDLVLQNFGTGNVQLSGKKIKGSAPTLVTDTTSTLATKGYVDNVVTILNSTKYVFTVDITNQANPENFIISRFLNVMLPPIDPQGNTLLDIPDQSEARVVGIGYILPPLTTNVTFAGQYINVDKGGIQNSASVLYGIPGITVNTVAGQTPVSIQKIFRFYVSGQIWIADPNNPIG